VRQPEEQAHREQVPQTQQCETVSIPPPIIWIHAARRGAPGKVPDCFGGNAKQEPCGRTPKQQAQIKKHQEISRCGILAFPVQVVSGVNDAPELRIKWQQENGNAPLQYQPGLPLQSALRGPRRPVPANDPVDVLDQQ